MRTIPMKFRFKEHRDYVHGTDIYNQMLQQIRTIYQNEKFGAIKLGIHYVASKHCNMILGDIGKALTKPKHVFVDLLIRTSNGDILGFLTETNEPVDGRVDYDEDRIEALCRIDGDKIMITGDSGYSPIEAAVSMTKQLHYKLFPINQAKWFFTRLDLMRPFKNDDSAKLSIVFKNNFHNRLTKSEIFSDKEPIGHIYFSLVKR